MNFLRGTRLLNVRLNNCQSIRSFSFESIARTQTGIFTTLSNSTPVEYAQNFLLNVHDITGLPWWASIICSTIAIRGCITLPLAIYQNYILAKIENVNVEMGEISKELKKEVAMAVKMYEWDEKTARYHYKRSISKQYNNLIVRENCHPLKSALLVLFQIPLWVSFSVAIRNLVYMLPKSDVTAELIYLQLTAGGFGWIPNLVEIDSSLILPVVFGLLNLAIIEIQTLSKVRVPSKMSKIITNLVRAISVLMVPIAATVPSCLVLYWTTSSAFGLVQNLVLMSPKVKRICRIPHTPSELENPYQYLMQGIKLRIKNITGVKV